MDQESISWAASTRWLTIFMPTFTWHSSPCRWPFWQPHDKSSESSSEGHSRDWETQASMLPDARSAPRARDPHHVGIEQPKTPARAFRISWPVSPLECRYLLCMV